MICPKCGAKQADNTQICDRCGIVFEKYYKYHPRPGEPVRTPTLPNKPSSDGEGIRELILPRRLSGDTMVFWLRAALLLVLMIWGLSLMLSPVASNAAGKSFLHMINLPFHEFGHILFRPLGQFMTSLGGTLGQLLMPMVCLGVLLLQTRDPFGASVTLWWLGENFLDIAPYMADARAGVMPLVGGNFGHSSPYGVHDWEYLLTESGLLHLDRQLAQATHLFGALIMLLALVWGGLLLYRQHLLLRR